MFGSRTPAAMRIGFGPAALIAVLSLSACTWSQSGYGPEHTGFSIDTSISGAAVESGSLLPSWTATTGGAVVASPAVDQNLVFVASKDQRLYAYNAPGTVGCSGSPKSCAPMWRSVDLGGPAWSSPAVSGGLVYIASTGGTLFAFDAAGVTGCSGTPNTCSPKWTAQLGGAVISSPTFADGRVYVVSASGDADTLSVFNATNGTRLWTASSGSGGGSNAHTRSSPTVANGIAYVAFTGDVDDPSGTLQARLMAFDAAGNTGCSGTPKTCEALWGTETGEGSNVTGTATVSDGTLYVSGRAFDAGGVTNCSGAPKRCRPMWSMTGGDGDTAVANGVVYRGGAAFDAAGSTNCSGSPKTCLPVWTAATGGDATSTASVANGVVYLGGTDYSGTTAGKLFAFDAAGVTNCSGTPKVCQPSWTGGTGAAAVQPPLPPARSAPAVVNGNVFIGSVDGKLYAFSLERVRPTNSMLVPHSGDVVSGVITVSTDAADNIGVGRVELHLTGGAYRDVVFGLATPGGSSWDYSWDTTRLADGTYTLWSIAFDFAGNQARSADVGITIQNGPLSQFPTTVSADALPTVQVTGIVWAQALVGNTVYATGNFTKARPAGVAAGVNEVTRTHLLAYDITNGQLLPFNHSLNGEGRAITASPDGSRIYVGGKFTTVDGASHPRLAAFNAIDGSLVTSFTGGVNGTVRTLAATNAGVYAGGEFSAASNGQTRGRLVAYSATGSLLNWKPSADRTVASMVMSPDQTKVIFGGSFSSVNGMTYHGLAAADRSTGIPSAWASQSDTFAIRDDGTSSGITNLSTDGTTVFLTGFNTGNVSKPGGFEGRAAISPGDGTLMWLSDCHGDSYSSVAIGNVLYSVGHAHDCQPINAFPEAKPRVWHRALAETIYATHTNGPGSSLYWSYHGLPTSTQLNWYPDVNTGPYSGASQGGWSMVGNSSYISMGGEFTRVNGKGQQALARFAIRSLAPNKVGPEPYSGPKVSAGSADTLGEVAVSWPATWDRDDAVLTYQLYRDGASVPLFTTTEDARFWRLPTMTYTDAGLVPGSTHSYRVVVTDPFGNRVATTN